MAKRAPYGDPAGAVITLKFLLSQELTCEKWWAQKLIICMRAALARGGYVCARVSWLRATLLAHEDSSQKPTTKEVEEFLERKVASGFFRRFERGGVPYLTFGRGSDFIPGLDDIGDEHGTAKCAVRERERKRSKKGTPPKTFRQIDREDAEREEEARRRCDLERAMEAQSKSPLLVPNQVTPEMVDEWRRHKGRNGSQNEL